jgi:pyruvate kinase
MRKEPSTDPLAQLRTELEHLHDAIVAVDGRYAALLAGLHETQRPSAINLLHYLMLRSHDIRDLQEGLHEAGLSSLASSESHVLYQVQAVLERLGRKTAPEQRSISSYEQSRQRVLDRRVQLFGPVQQPALPHIMVTFDTEFAQNYYQVRDLMLGGMNVARINCAHDGPEVWAAMIDQIRHAERDTGRTCKIYMDLAGPKIRTAIPGKGHEKGRVKCAEGQRLLLVEPDALFPVDEAVIACTLRGVVSQLRPGERVLFDDGLFEARVNRVRAGVAELYLTRISAAKPRIKAEKGINFPDSELTLDCLTEEDRANLPFIRRHADLVGYSFVRHADDLARLQQELYVDGARNSPAIVVKIETPRAVYHLPELVFQGMRYPLFGVMIARGDLAVEIGFERLSEVQEEILWICEAGHVPVIWATQVLETLNKTGIATRSEVTDAVVAAMAECVMINKGAHLLSVLPTLRDILLRAGGHRLKKRYTLRPLSIAQNFIDRL